MAPSTFALRVASLTSCAVTFGLAACSSDSLIPTAAPSASASRDAGGIPNGGDGSDGNNGNHFAYGHAKVCAVPAAGEASLSLLDHGRQGRPAGRRRHPVGLRTGGLETGIQSHRAGAGTVAIVDAFDDPNAESDLAAYRKQFGLSVCSTANGCFKKINQNGGSTTPRADAGWAEEISLDLDMVSAICPGCKILLVEASSNSFANLVAAVDRAAITTGVVAISNSYGGTEYSGEVSDESHYNHPNVAITVSSGDDGFGVEFPAASQFVTAVGGTHLTHSGSVYTETAWTGAGSGCSAYITKPGRGKPTAAVHAGLSPTFPRLRIRTPASPSTIRTASAGAAVGGSCSAARAWPRRSSPRSMLSPTTFEFTSPTDRSRMAT